MRETNPLVNQRKREPLCARWYCAAIAAGVATVAAAGVSAYSSSQKAGAASDAQGALSNRAAAYGTKVKTVDPIDNVNLPGFDPKSGVQDYANNLPMLAVLSKFNTNQAATRRDQLTGGEASRNLKQEGVDIGQMLGGEVPKDVQDKVNRIVAERSGGAFSPSGPANQQATADFARSIGKTSTDIMNQGLSFAPQWESLVDSFTYKPQQAYLDALNGLRARNDYTLGAAQVQLKRDENQYTEELNKNKMKASADPGVAGSVNDNLQLQTIGANANANEANALIGAAKGIGSIYTGAAAGGSDLYNSAGFISNAGLGAATQSYATPGYTPQFGYTPGSGYYFNGYTSS